MRRERASSGGSEVWVSDQLTCDVVEREGIAGRYLAGRLGPDREREFEAHYLTCERCQGELHFAAGMDAVLRGPHVTVRRGTRLWVGATLGAAAALVGLLLLRPALTSPRFTALGEVSEPPLYLGVAVRSEGSRADSLFESAMAAYVDRRYGAAADGLARALAAGADTLVSEFFLASALLMERRDREAVRVLRRVIDSGDAAYLPEARYFLAKALLRLGRWTDALAQLRLAGAHDVAPGPAARALGDSVEALLAR
jgi:hypothetical protein